MIDRLQCPVSQLPPPSVNNLATSPDLMMPSCLATIITTPASLTTALTRPHLTGCTVSVFRHTQELENWFPSDPYVCCQGRHHHCLHVFIALFMDGILWDSIDSKKDPVTRRIGCQVFNNNYNYISPSLKINTTFQCAVVVLLILSAVS